MLLSNNHYPKKLYQIVHEKKLEFYNLRILRKLYKKD